MSCHSRWCPRYLPAFMDNITHLPVTALCTDVSYTFQNYLNSSTDQLLIEINYWWIYPACQLWCGEPVDQLLQLQAAGASRTMAKLIWFVVILMMTCAGAQLLTIWIEWGGREVAMVGGPFFLAFMSLIVTFSSSDYDTVFYPIVGAMSVASLSYYFSSFQYSIGVTYELASAAALVFTMFPVYNLFIGKKTRFYGYEYDIIDQSIVEELKWIVFSMLILSLLWIIHSSIYRTVMFRASWIAAFRRQLKEKELAGVEGAQLKNYMSGLWILSGAQGHPTWRTPTGQSFGLYLTVLSCFVTIKVHDYLIQGDYCKEDLILFRIWMYRPPGILALAVLATQICMCKKASCHVQGNIISLLQDWLMVDFKFLWESRRDMEEALINYKLGRDTLEVEDTNEGLNYKSTFHNEKLDKGLAGMLWIIEGVLMLIAYPGLVVCKIAQWLGIYFLHIIGFERAQDSSSFRSREKIKAYQIVCEHCSKDIKPSNGEESIYGRLRKKSHDGSQLVSTHLFFVPSFLLAIKSWFLQKIKNYDGLGDSQIDEAVCTMLKKRGKHIKLSVVLDKIGPSGFEYVLAMLVKVLNKETSGVEGNEETPLPHSIVEIASN